MVGSAVLASTIRAAHNEWRFAVMAAAVGLFAATAGNGPAVTAVVALGCLVFNGSWSTVWASWPGTGRPFSCG